MACYHGKAGADRETQLHWCNNMWVEIGNSKK